MASPAQIPTSQPVSRLHRAFFVLSLLFSFTTIAMRPARAQTFSVVYSFQAEGQAGFYPTSGVTVDHGGNLYGTAEYGGPGTSCYLGCGTVFKLTRHGSSWTLAPLYDFLGNDDGGNPNARVVIGPNGTLFGTTTQGGGSGCMGLGCGTVFNLQPPQHAVGNLIHTWPETVLYRFQGGNDGAMPEAGDLAFDQADNIYGTTDAGGDSQNCQGGCGTVYKLTHSNGNWTESILHVFGQAGDGDEPFSGVIFDQTGNLYGATASDGAHQQGSVFELIRSGVGWTERLLYSFTGGSDGSYPFYGLVFDPAGDLYGTTCCNGSDGAGTVFELTAGAWAFNLVYSFGAPGAGQGPEGSMIMDSAGNLYGTASGGGAYGFGAAFKLSPGNGGWTYTSLHDFCAGGYPPCSDGYTPTGSLAFDSEGNLYGTTSNGGQYGGGVVYEIAP
ncbi:MAG: choice-of-anchor tandem repeat GloVer-containing protein [Candidatus Korobacteraceae bacterium]